MARKYRVVVTEIITHEIVFEAESEDDAENTWIDYFGDDSADDVIDMDCELEYAEPYDD